MKKIFLSMMAIAAALFMPSCSNDDLVEQESAGNETTVSFTVGLNGQVAKRAISDGLKAKKLIMAVYDADGNELPALRQTNENAFQGGLTETVQVTLAKGQTYSFAFWAQNAACDAYNTTDLERIEIDYSQLTSNDDKRDAFFANKTLTVGNTAFTEPVTLKRPFAQVNFGVTPEEWQSAVDAGINVESVKVNVNEVYQNFNILTGEASGAVVDKTFADTVIVKTATATAEAANGELLTLDLDGDNTKEDYYWMAMNYLLVNAENAANVTFTFTTNREEITVISNNTPLKRNYRTNLIGRLTTEGTFNLVIDPIYDAENNGSIANDQADVTELGVKAGGKYYATLEAALAAGETDINLSEGEWELPATAMAKAGVSANVKLTGVSHSAKVKVGATNLNNTFNFNNVTVISNTASFTVNGNNFNNCIIEGAYTAATEETFTKCSFKNAVTATSTVTFENCAFATESALSITNANVSIEGCEFTTTGTAITISNTSEYTVTIGATTAAGTLYTAEGEGELVVEIANGVKNINGVYEISNADGMFWFAEQVNEVGNSFSGKTVKLTENIDLANQLWSPVGQTGQPAFFKGTFDGNDKTISNLRIDETSDNATYHGAGLFGWFEGNGPVVKNLTVDCATVKGHHYVGTIIAYCEEGGMIQGCTVKNAAISCVFNTVTNDDGDKAGAVVGYLRGNADDCHAEDCAIDAGRDAGQIVGAGIEANVTNCTATRVTVVANGTANGSNIREEIVGRLL